MMHFFRLPARLKFCLQQQRPWSRDRIAFWSVGASISRGKCLDLHLLSPSNSLLRIIGQSVQNGDLAEVKISAGSLQRTALN